MTQSRLLPVSACLVIGSLGIGGADAQDQAVVLGTLTGFQEVPAILSTGTGTFTGTLT